MARTQIQTTIRGRSLGFSTAGALMLNLVDNTQVVIDGNGLTYTNLAGITTQIGGSSGGARVVSGTSDTVTTADRGFVIVCTSSSPTTINVDSTFGSYLLGINQQGTGLVTVAGSGVTFTSPNGMTTTGKGSSLTLLPTSPTTYDVVREAAGGNLQTVAASGATPTIDMLQYETVEMTLSANCTPSFTGMVSGASYSITLVIHQNASAAKTFTLPTTKWHGGSAWVMSTTLSAVDIVTLMTLDGGTTWYGFLGGKGMA